MDSKGLLSSDTNKGNQVSPLENDLGLNNT